MTPVEVARKLEELRPNWRAIPVVDLTDDEVKLMSPAEIRWCHDLLRSRLTRPRQRSGGIELTQPSD